MNKFTWKSPPCQVVSFNVRTIEKTKKDYAVIKVLVVAMNYPNRKEERAFKGRETTLMCFKETLLPVVKTDDILMFEGDVSFAWGSTYLNVTKISTESGKRLLRKEDRSGDCLEDGECDVCSFDGRCSFQRKEDRDKLVEKEIREVRTISTGEMGFLDGDRIPW